MNAPAAQPTIVPVIFGTAGHIDHGKSSLVRALTGTDPDRLKEERKRGITIELGFAFLNERVAFIDVPGHEKFVKHMVAGAATVDYAVLVIAADDGVMPQTREHLDILNLLGVQGGLVALTKADLVDEEWLEFVKEEVSAFIEKSVLSGAPVIPCDSLSGRGLPEIREAILRTAARKRIQGGRDFFRMPVDRVFTMKGFGTVVTGSALSGSVSKGDLLEVRPSGLSVRVKGLQSAGKPVERVAAGQRGAVNLSGVSVSDIERGRTLASPGLLKESRLFDARLSLLASSPTPLKHRQRVHFHTGTADLLARVVLLDRAELSPGEDAFVQLRLESPGVAMRLDRFVIRRYSPQITIGGGVILDANPVPHKRNRPAVTESLARLESGGAAGVLLAGVEKAPFSDRSELAKALSLPEEDAAAMAETLLHAGSLLSFTAKGREVFAASALFEAFLRDLAAEISAYHQKAPLRAGLRQGDAVSKIRKRYPKAAPPLFIEHALRMSLLHRPGGDLLALPDFRVELSKAQRKLCDRIGDALREGVFQPPSPAEIAGKLGAEKAEVGVLLQYLVDTDRALCLEGNLFFDGSAISGARETLAELFAKTPRWSVSELRERLGTSRKFAIPLLNHFDAIGWTVREDDLRTAGRKLSRTADADEDTESGGE